MSCDMNVNSRLGLYNSWLLRHYCMFKYPFVPNLIRGVKTWAKSKNLNNPSVTGLTVSFSSYSLALMTIAYLQHLGALPNCQADPDPIFRTHFWEGRGSNSRNITVRYGACKGWKPSGRVPSVGEWLKFYGERFDYTTEMISIRHGGIIRRPQHLPPDLEYSHFRGSIVVLDPFLNKNCTRFIKEETLQEFRAKCSVGAADSIRRWESLKARHQTQARSQSDDEEEPDPWTDLMASR
ncbi:hypothetical protein PYCCODRAFT_375893 [Trametes coccinea BRFM310]|uniref:PAP-associated domain-containing protein n=1 Tax=Trametes coccinea (strain BRFM310) TaxID=1353009 RepID=A0A1Y2J3K0_TRAC3|nr:hypothetical protein PYCCODRAFT_375893 [Trametes coccinea BRFM310]